MPRRCPARPSATVTPEISICEPVGSPFAVHINRCSGLLTLAEHHRVPRETSQTPFTPTPPIRLFVPRFNAVFIFCGGPESRQSLCPWPNRRDGDVYLDPFREVPGGTENSHAEHPQS